MNSLVGFEFLSDLRCSPCLNNSLPAEFHNRSLSEHANLQAEYVLWRQNKDPTALCSLCQVRLGVQSLCCNRARVQETCAQPNSPALLM